MEGTLRDLKRSLATVIERRRDEVIRRWLTRVSLEVGISGVPPTELRNALPDYLLAVRDELINEKNPALDRPGTAAWRELTREHAVTRVRLGFDIRQLVREFILLRQVLQEVMVEEGVLDPRPPILTELIEAAVVEAVHSYVQAREHAARRLQAEHLGFVIHELRNPLNVAKLAITQLRQEASPHQLRLIDLVERNQRHMAELIDRILEGERLAAAAPLQCRREKVRLGEVLAEALFVSKCDAEAKGLAFHATCDPTLVITADPILLRSAVQNLVENAVKYSDEGTVEVSVEQKERQAVIHVRDGCGGLSRDELRTIFEPFSRGNSGKPGTGLGLAIARRSIEAQGGQLQAESPGDGRCHFWITLPKG